MILRFKSKLGILRINVEEKESIGVVFNKLKDHLGEINEKNTFFGREKDVQGETVETISHKLVLELGYNHGDIVYVSYESDVKEEPKKIVPVSRINDLKLVDDVFLKKSGLLKRKRTKFCLHGEKGMCEYCMPIPLWDSNYVKEKKIKHISFHTYLKSINLNVVTTNNQNNLILEEPNYSINTNCQNGHAPYPKGICSRCQTPPITLRLQKFRMVDHVEFSSYEIINNFIESWRNSGCQRFGFMYGKYSIFDEETLRTSAVVEYIYEPPQVSEPDCITLLEWENESVIEEISEKLGFYRIGMIFTDLVDTGNKNSTVLCKRHKDSFFLTNLEILMIARYQLKYPYSTPYSRSNFFSSNFVTCVVSGGLDGEIIPRCYQVSLEAEALVKYDIISPTLDPSLMVIKKKDKLLYVPEISYMKTNAYGLEEKTSSKTLFPADFLIVSLLDSVPLNPNPFFNSLFPIANRLFMGIVQDLLKVYSHFTSCVNPDSPNSELISSIDHDLLKKKLPDFQFLSYLFQTSILSDSEFDLLLSFVKTRLEEDYDLLKNSPGWLSLFTILDHVNL